MAARRRCFTARRSTFLALFIRNDWGCWLRECNSFAISLTLMFIIFSLFILLEVSSVEGLTAFKILMLSFYLFAYFIFWAFSFYVHWSIKRNHSFYFHRSIFFFFFTQWSILHLEYKICTFAISAENCPCLYTSDVDLGNLNWNWKQIWKKKGHHPSPTPNRAAPSTQITL